MIENQMSYNTAPVKQENEQSEDERINAILDEHFRSKINQEFSLSVNLPKNTDANLDPEGDWDGLYRRILAEYRDREAEVHEYEMHYNASKKRDYTESPNIGWKFHLNVTSNNVTEVSQYLKENGYIHKYLSGGNPEEGKVFTVYIGSHTLAKKLAEEVSQDLGDKLCQPAASGEIELAAGVVGRFSVHYSPFDSGGYGTCGFSLLEHRRMYIHFFPEDRQEEQIKYIKSIEVEAYEELISQYGEYFFSPNQEN